MDNLMQADIFFFISSTGFIILFSGAVVILVYIVQIVREVKAIVRRFSNESDAVIEDVRSLRETIKAQKGRILAFLGSWFIMKEFRSRKKKAKK